MSLKELLATSLVALACCTALFTESLAAASRLAVPSQRTQLAVSDSSETDPSIAEPLAAYHKGIPIIPAGWGSEFIPYYIFAGTKIQITMSGLATPAVWLKKLDLEKIPKGPFRKRIDKVEILGMVNKDGKPFEVAPIAFDTLKADKFKKITMDVLHPVGMVILKVRYTIVIQKTKEIETMDYDVYFNILPKPSATPNEEAGAPTLRIYPSQVTDVLKADYEGELAIYSLSGTRLYHRANYQRGESIAVSSWPPGIYLVKSRTGVARFVKR